MKTFIYVAIAIIATVLLVVSIRMFGGCPSCNGTNTDLATSTELIRVTTPLPNALVRSPLIVSGEARGNWYFEASFPLVLVDWDGKIIAEGHAQAKGEWMTTDYVPFEGTLIFEKPQTGGGIPNRGTLILKKEGFKSPSQNVYGRNG